MLRRYTRLRPVALKPKKGRIEDPAFLAFVRRQPCLLRGKHRCRGPVDPHHVGHYGQARRNDRKAVPLCRSGHDLAHKYKRTFETRFGIDFEREIARLNRMFDERVKLIA